MTSFAVPFLAAAVLGVVALAALVWQPESRVGGVDADSGPPFAAAVGALQRGPLRGLLTFAVAAQFGLALFEATFALTPSASGTTGRRRSGGRS